VSLEPNEALPLDVTTPAESFSALLRTRGLDPTWDGAATDIDIPEATTVIAFRYADGVIVAGDRRATAGNFIAHRRVQKVYAADEYSAVAISGVAGIAVELTRLFQTELEHYEKIEGRRLSLEGKANHLSGMIRRQLPMAMQGLVVIPLFAGFDRETDEGRLYSFDVVGGRYDETDYTATGSGGRDARLFLRTSYEEGMAEAEALSLAVASLVAAAEDDTATGGPDPARGIYPTLVLVTADGYRELDEDAVAEISQAVLEDRA
jgi:proteasome beta subunit